MVALSKMPYKVHNLPVLENIDKSYSQLIYDVENYPPRHKAKLSAFIWWRLCHTVPSEDIKSLKNNISYDITQNMGVHEVKELLISYGFKPDYVEAQTKSTVVDFKHKE